MDDTFTLFTNKNDALSFLHYLNGRHNNIKFTTESEQNDEIPFLDILLKRNLDSSFSTSIYRKKSFNGLYIKWDSFTLRKYKINLVRTLAYRCITICLSPRLLYTVCLDDLKRILLLNGYPMGTVNDVIDKHQINKISRKILYKQLIKKKFLSFCFLRLSQKTPHKTFEVLYKQILWYFQPHNNFS